MIEVNDPEEARIQTERALNLLATTLNKGVKGMEKAEKETAVYYNPNGGKKFHTTAYCSSVRSTYLPLSRITYGDLSYYPYNELVPCGTCNAPARPEVAAAWNSAIDEALEELEIEALINSQFTDNGASEESAR